MATKAPREDDDFIHDPPAGDQPADLAWQERAYFTFHGPGGIGMDYGFGRHPSAGANGSYSAYACLNTGDAQVNVRAKGPLSARLGVPDPRPFEVEMVEPYKTWRVRLDEERLGMDLTFEARSAMGALPHAEIVGRKGQAASTQVLFQSGRYHGELRVGDETIAVDGWPGSRDRTWGYRRHEGRLPSGLLCAMILELDDHELILWSVERHTGERVMQAGARLFEDGSVTTVDDWAFDLSLQAELGKVEGATVRVGDEEYALTPTGSTVYLAGGGYLAKGRHGDAAEQVEVESETWDMTSDATLAAITGVDDHVVTVGGAREGSGILELQIGRHHRYLPDGWPSLHEDVAALGS